MSTRTSGSSEHDEIQSMLPWLVNRSLDDGQTTTVLSHVEECEDCQREVQFLASLQETIQNDAQSHYAEHADVDKGLASVMSRINSDEHHFASTASSPSSFKQQLDKLIDFVSVMSVPQWGATAAAGLLVAVLGFQVLQNQPASDYSVLSSSAPQNVSMRLSVELSDSQEWAEIRPVIEAEFDKLGRGVDFTTQANGGHVVLLPDPLNVVELGQLIADLEKLETISQVELIP
ncbi:MAG: hypothetical protein AB8B97_12015 [Granulosicoccus sp.]